MTHAEVAKRRAALKVAYVSGVRLELIAEAFGVTRSRVSQMIDQKLRARRVKTIEEREREILADILATIGQKHALKHQEPTP